MANVASLFQFKATDGSMDTDFEIRKIKASKIIVLPQVRTEFDDSSIEELAQSIKEIGLQEPLTVKSDPKGEFFTLINGERRYRALKRLAGDQFSNTLVECKVQLKNVDTDIVELVQIADNMVRKDLTVSEQAKTVKRLSDKGLTLDKIGAAIGKDKTSVSKLLSLSEMPERFTPLFSITEDFILLYNFKVLADKFPSSPKVDQFANQCISEREITRAAVKALKMELEGKTQTPSSGKSLEAQDAGNTEEALQASHPSEDNSHVSEEKTEESSDQSPEQDSSVTSSSLNVDDSNSETDSVTAEEGAKLSVSTAAHDPNKSESEKKRIHSVSKFLSYNKRTNKLVFLLDDNRKVEVSPSQVKIRL